MMRADTQWVQAGVFTRWLEESPGLALGIAIVVVGLIVIDVFAHLSGLYDDPCPRCHRKRAYSKSWNFKTEGGWFSGTTKEEWRCKYCGYTTWEKMDDED